MKTLSTLLQQPLLQLPKPTSTTQKNPIIPHHKIIKNQHQNKNKWKIYAQPKGFSTPPPSSNTQQQKNKKKNDDDEKIPDVVWERMIVRILSFVGVPLIVGLGLLQVFGTIKEKHLLDVPIWVPFLTTFITFGASALGVAYGTLSTNWEADGKNSILGFEQAQKNWVEMWSEDDDEKSR